MDRSKIEELQLLLHEKLSGFSTVVLHNEDRKCVHCTINLSFRKEYELDNAIRVLQQLNT